MGLAGKISGNTIFSVIHPDSVQMVKEYHDLRMLGDSVPTRYGFRGVHKSGRTLALEVDVVELREADRIIGTRSYLWDVTQRHEAEEALRKSEVVPIKAPFKTESRFFITGHIGTNFDVSHVCALDCTIP